MRGYNSIKLSGSVISSELKYTPGGLAILNLQLGGIQNFAGKDLPFYQRVNVFGKYAEAIMDDMTTGTPLFVVGRLNFRQWEQNGEKRYAVEVTAERVVTLTGGETNPDSRGQPRLVGALNEVTLVGNLTRDGDLKYASSGTAIGRSSVAVNETYRDSQGNNQERVGFYNLEAWEALGERLGAAHKSSPVVAVGRLKNSSYEKDGRKVYTTSVELSEFHIAAIPNGVATRAPERELVAAAPAPARNKSFLDIDEEFPPEDDLPF